MDEPAGERGMDTRKAFGQLRRRLNGERRLKERHGEKKIVTVIDKYNVPVKQRNIVIYDHQKSIT